jgi:hypothetical protein
MIEFKIYIKGVSMKNKKMFLLIALIVTTVLLLGCSKRADAQESNGSTAAGSAEKAERKANGQYLIGSKIKIYDGDFKPTDAYFTYSPADKSVILNLPPPYINAAIFFMKVKKGDSIGYVRNSIDKSIEWAATAKQNKVSSLQKWITYETFGGIEDDGMAMYGLNQPNNKHPEPVYLVFMLYIGDLGDLNLTKKDKEETWLVMNYRTHNELQTRSLGHYYGFRENNFARLKEIFSESYLAEIDKKEEELQKSQAEQGALFK